MIERMVPDAEDAYARAQIEALARGSTMDLERDLDPSLRTAQTDEQMRAMVTAIGRRRIEGVEVIGYQGMNFNGTERRSITYQLRLAGGWAVAHVASRTEGGRRIVEGVSVTQIPEPLQRTHAFRLSGRSLAHYVVLGLSLLVPLLMIYAAALVFRMPLRRRWLWVLACVVGVGKWSLEWTSGHSLFNLINFQLLGAGFLRPSVYAPWVLSVSLPLGALYIIGRYHRGRWRQAPPIDPNADGGSNYIPASANAAEPVAAADEAP
ncbi:MAG TPA: hypothetical protein VLK84_19650 [Longimicrobium sp.]|nr:hypothetical protein [Longimicrobium sp.]